jgi:hypothetical protein
MKTIGLQIVSFVFILGLALSTMAAREVVSGTVDKVDAVKGLLVLKTAPALRLFEIRTPEKLLSLKPGDFVQLTIQEDGTVVVEQRPGKK